MRVALIQVPQVMQVAVAQDHEAAVLRPGVFARLLFGGQRVDVFGFGFQHQQGEAFVVQQQEVDKTLAAGFKIVTHGVHL